MGTITIPKHVKVIETKVTEKLKFVKKPNSDTFQTQQLYCDEVLKIYQDAFQNLIDGTITYSKLLNEIKNSYDNSLQIRDKRISQFITQERVFGISERKMQRDDKMKSLIKETEELKEQNLKLTFEITKLKKDIGKLKDEKFSEYLTLMRERDARYTLYYENLALQLKLEQLDGSARPADDAAGDPVVLRIALDRCREQLTATQRSLRHMSAEYADAVPRRQHYALEARARELAAAASAAAADRDALRDALHKTTAAKRSAEEELAELTERCRELERAGTPRPHWDACGDFVRGGRGRWAQLAGGLSSRERLRALLRELGPAAESDQLEYFEGLGADPSVPAYLRHEGRVRNLRLARRDVLLLVADAWRAREAAPGPPLQDFLADYFRSRYQQPSLRAEWAYNLCAGAQQLLDEPQVRLFWGALTGALSERVYWGLRDEWRGLRAQLYRHSRDRETISMEEFEKVCKATFPLKSDVDIKSLCDVARRQLKMKINRSELNLDRLFQENEEGFDRIELARELFRQRQLAQDRYIREVVAELGGRRAPERLVSVDALKRAFAIVDPAIDHIRMESYIRWAFGDNVSPLDDIGPAPLKTLAARLAAGDIERVGPRYRSKQRRTNH